MFFIKLWVLVLLEVRCSPTKPCGKGSKRKQDDLDEEEELEQQSWVEALNQELIDEDQSADPDYEVCSLSGGLQVSSAVSSTCTVDGLFLCPCSPVPLRLIARSTAHTTTRRAISRWRRALW